MLNASQVALIALAYFSVMGPLVGFMVYDWWSARRR